MFYKVVGGWKELMREGGGVLQRGVGWEGVGESRLGGRGVQR